jgi:transposase InsO family protein
MLVEQVETVRAEVNASYRRVLKAADIPRSSFARWRSRIQHQELSVQTPGPKKEVQLNLDALLAEVRQMEHGRRRSLGTTPLYQAHHQEISRRQLQGLVKEERLRMNAVRLAKLRKITWQVPGMAWAMDNTELGLVDLHQVQDLASRYKYESFVAASVHGEQVAEHLERLIQTHGAPLILKRDRGSNLRDEAVEAVLQNHLIIPLDSPPRYPAYNGAIEYAQREMKELLAERYPGVGHILACNMAAAQELNHRPRPCLQGRTSCAVLGSGREAMQVYTRPKRKEVIDWIKKEMLAILQVMEGSSAGVRACDAAWRRAVETWLHRNGAITVSVNGKVLPCYP